MKTSELKWKYFHHKSMLSENRKKGEFYVTHMHRYVLFQTMEHGDKFQGEVTQTAFATHYQLPDGVQRTTDMTVEQAKDLVFRKALENG